MHSDPQELEAPGESGNGPQHAAVKPCDSCSMCCKLLHVTALNKPQGRWCVHHAGGKCGIHAVKPFECSAFQCFWTVTPSLGEDWRPDRAKFILWSDGPSRLIVEVDSAFPHAWRKDPYYAQLKLWADRHRPQPLEILVRVRGRLLVLFPETEIDLGPFQPEASVDSGYRIEGGRRVAYARFVEPATIGS